MMESSSIKNFEEKQEKDFEAAISDSGILITRHPENATFTFGEFCVETTWESPIGFKSPEEEAITLSCDFCSEKVLCESLRHYYKQTVLGDQVLDDAFACDDADDENTDFDNDGILDYEDDDGDNDGVPDDVDTDDDNDGIPDDVDADDDNDGIPDYVGHNEDKKCKQNKLARNLLKVLIGETKDFEEFKDKIEALLEEIWMLLFSDRKVYYLMEFNRKGLTLKADLLLRFTEFMFWKLDLDFDDELSLADYLLAIEQDRTRQELENQMIYLPGPLYLFHKTVDKDLNKGITINELQDFIKKAFHVIDQNQDCMVSQEEMIIVLDSLNVPKVMQLVARQLLQQNHLVLQHATERFLHLADSNRDNFTSIDEALNFGDFRFISDEGESFLMLSEPNPRFINLILKGSSEGNTWLATLLNFVESINAEAYEEHFKCT